MRKIKGYAQFAFLFVWRSCWIIPAAAFLLLAAVCVAVAYGSIKAGLTWFHDAR